MNSVTCRGTRETTRTYAHSLARILPNSADLGPEIEEGAVNRHPLQVLFLLPRGGARPATIPGAILLHSTSYIRGVGCL